MHPETIQENQYSIPYHYLPHEEGAEWRIFQTMPWGYEYLAMLEVITSTVLRYQPASVLDFGCGDGRLAYELTRAGIPQVAGVDISARAIDMARAIVRSPGVEFHGSLKEVEGRKFDVIAAVEVLEHIPDDDLRDVIPELGDLLTPEGVLVVSVPTTNVPLISKHYRHYTLEKLDEQTHPIFDVKHVEYIGRLGLANKVTRRMLYNRFVLPNWSPWLRLTTRFYRRFVMHADASTGVHLIAVLGRKDHS